MKPIKRRALILLCALALLLPYAAAAQTRARPNGDARSYYEIFLYSYKDGNGDGIGDFAGASQALGYISDMGFDGIWLTPISKAASYHKYDVIDYIQIDPDFGALADFEAFMAACAERGINVILDLVVNHTSDKHPWFISAKRSVVIEPCGQEVCAAEGLCRAHNKYCEYYNFIKTDAPPSGHTALGGGWCYESVFWSGMPDLNLNCAHVRAEIERVIDFYMDRGVGGFRLDAVIHFGHSTGESVEILKWISDYVKARDNSAYLVAEAWTGLTEMLPYYAGGTDSLFNFAFGTSTGRTAKTLVYTGKPNSASAYESALINLQSALSQAAPDAIDAPFGSNHDTGRIAGFMRRNEAKIKMYAALNLTMTGCVFVYYGEELGMSGSGKDENVRAPMYWTSDEGAEGMTRGPIAMEKQTHAFGALDTQTQDPESIYNFYKAALAIRNAYPAISRGEVSVIEGIEHEDICAIRKTYMDESVYLIYNLSETETITVNAPDGLGIAAQLSAARGSERAALNDGALACPPMSVTVLSHYN